ncbi:Pro-Pol polyprotein, partial [Araneus ventricosus]
MTFLAKGKKCDLITLATEMGEEPSPDMNIMGLKALITGSQSYEEEFVKGMLDTIISSRKEEAEKEEKKFQLEKMRIEAGMATPNGNLFDERQVHYNSRIEMSKAMPKFDAKESDIVLYMSLFERQAKRLKIDPSDWVSCLIPLMPTEIVELVARVPEEEFFNFEYIKGILMKKFKLNAEGFRQKFVQHQRTPEKSWKDFVYEVTNYFQGWINDLNITDFDGLKNLFITDQVKKRVPQEVRDHFVDVWGTIAKPQDLADKLDGYECVRKTNRKPANLNPKVQQQGNVRSNTYSRDNGDHNVNQKPMKQEKGFPRSQYDRKDRQKFTCYSCGGEGHVKKFCPKLVKTNSDQDSRRKANVLRTVVDQERVTKKTAVVAEVMSRGRSSVDQGLCNLERIPVSVNGKQATALIDSGTEITVIRRDLLMDFPIEDKASIYIKGIFGPPEKCPLMNVPMGIIAGKDGNMIQQEVLCAIAPSLMDDVLLPPEIRDKLKGVPENYLFQDSEGNTGPTKAKDKEFVLEVDNDNADKNCKEVKTLSIGNSENETEELSRSDKFLKDQIDCSVLEDARKCAEKKSGGFYFRNNFLFHKEKVLGESVAQLVLPKKYRPEVLKLAHCSVFGGHMGARKTIERIRYSFYWVGMSRDIKAFCQQCKDCQLRRRINCKDRVPITPVARPELPFQVVNIDIIGPIDPPSTKGHRYVLCLVDQHTRWAEALPLTSLTAKATCEALLTIFMRTGVPNVIASDNGTNFNASLTQEFEKRMGSSPRFSTPLHPESNGLVERFNQTLKKMLHHVILEEPRSWHTKIPFVLWAYREVPNSTTGVAPFQLLYGRKPEGPLSILKNTWMAGQEGLQLDTTPVTLYMEKLKKQLEDAAENAKLISTIQQEKMAHHYNLRSTKKIFNPGDK